MLCRVANTRTLTGLERCFMMSMASAGDDHQVGSQHSQHVVRIHQRPFTDARVALLQPVRGGLVSLLESISGQTRGLVEGGHGGRDERDGGS